MHACSLFLLLALHTAISEKNSPSFQLIAAGSYEVGEHNNQINPLRIVYIESFMIAATEVTNEAYKKFTDATHYITDAEKYHDAMIFYTGLDEFEWEKDTTATWKYPNGISRGGIQDKMDHPVTCISFHDALAYCNWAKVRLPSLDEWEIACRANTSSRFFFGDNENLIYIYANIWHGKNHQLKDEGGDYLYTAPVASYAPNNNGLFDMYGNVFEFCSNNPMLFKTCSDFAYARGGSWWCSTHSCGFFNSADIGRVSKHASFSNHGFRVVQR